MARNSNKTSKVMNLIVSEKDGFSDPASPPEVLETPEPPPPPKPKKSRRRAVVGPNLKADLGAEAVALPPLLNPPSEFKTVYAKPAGERQVVNVAALLINEQLGYALERFNTCACAKCCLEITLRALRELPPTFIHVTTIDDADTVNSEIGRLRPEVIKTLTKLVLAARNNPYHKFYTDFT